VVAYEIFYFSVFLPEFVVHGRWMYFFLLGQCVLANEARQREAKAWEEKRQRVVIFSIFGI
jgi:hypothetical protein